VPKPALFVVKATIAPEREAAFNEWYNTRRAAEAARVPGLMSLVK
jgi:antibiotic biosynthesis monooxygenase (ABM) superfamily enzyme